MKSVVGQGVTQIYASLKLEAVKLSQEPWVQ